jgi:ABC-2 type transport system permease protein
MNPFVREIAALTKRWFLHSARQPISIAAGLFYPLIWLFLFGSVFRNLPSNALAQAGGNYTGFLAAGVIVFTAFSGALSSGVPVLFDKENKFLDRLLVAPLVSRYSIVISSALHIAVMSFLQTAVVLAVSAAFGEGLSLSIVSVGGVFLATGLLILGFTALSLGLAFGLNAHFEMLSLIQVLALPMIFISSALAPIPSMPEWLQWPASLNPLTMAIEPVRHLLLGGGVWTDGPILQAPWGTLGIAGCLLWLLAFDAACFGALALFLRRFFR